MSPSRVVVTGVAGFVGSRLAARLVDDGFDVLGVDCFTSYYDESVKRSNIARLDARRFRLVEADLRADDLAPLIAGAEVIFHQAGQTGVRGSWADGFKLYAEHNVLATQRLLEAVRDRPIRRFVYASSSSIYGNGGTYPSTEDQLPQPHSPYGVTKLAGEHLCSLYASNWGIPTLALRYFTVYGAHQRPDMAIFRLISAALDQTPFPLFGDGSQIRDFTHVTDVVAANLAAARSDAEPGVVANIAGGSSIDMRGLVEAVESAVGREIQVDKQPEQPGDVARTGASVRLAEELLGWRPVTDLEAGIREQVNWQRALRADRVAPATD